MSKMLLLKLSVVLSFVFLVAVYFEWDRQILLRFRSYDGFLDEYRFKPPASINRRVVLLFKEHEGIGDRCIADETLKSCLDQSVKVDSFSVQTDDNSKYKHLRSFLTTHVPDTEHIYEGDATTIIIPIKSGVVYPYDFVETYVDQFPNEPVRKYQMRSHDEDLRNISLLRRHFFTPFVRVAV